MLDRPESGKGVSGPADEGDVDMGDAVPSDEAPQAKRMKGFVAASKPSHAVVNKLVTLEPVVSKAGYFKLPAAAGFSRGFAAGHNGAGNGGPLPQVCRQGPHAKLGSPHLGGLCPDEDPAPALAVPAKQGGDWRPAHAQAGCRAGRLRPHVQVVRHWVAGGGQAVLGLPGLGVRSIPGAFGHLQVRGHHLPLADLGRQAGLVPAAGRGKPGCLGQEVGGWLQSGRPPPKTDSMDEITMADVVPLDKRVDIRQEILTMDADAEGNKIQDGPPGAGQSAAVPPGGGGPELQALPPPGPGRGGGKEVAQGDHHGRAPGQ